MLDNNSLVTNRILVSGEGIHKTYEESFFKCLSPSEFARYFGNSVSGLFKNANGEIEVSYCYGGYETAINNTDLKKVEVLNIALLDDKFVVEFIESSILHNHLLNEKIEREQEMSLTLK